MNATIALLACIITAASAEPTGFDARVTVEMRHASLPRYLDALSSQAKLNFILTEGFEDEKVTAFLHEVTVADALDVIRELKTVDYRQIGRGNTYVVARKGSRALIKPEFLDGGPELDKKVNVLVHDAPLDRFFDELSRQAKVSFAVDETLSEKRITANLKNVTVREALETVAAMKGVLCRKLQGKKVYEIKPAAVQHEVGERFRKQ